jgi:hypothetical protein
MLTGPRTSTARYRPGCIHRSAGSHCSAEQCWPLPSCAGSSSDARCPDRYLRDRVQRGLAVLQGQSSRNETMPSLCSSTCAGTGKLFFRVADVKQPCSSACICTKYCSVTCIPCVCCSCQAGVDAYAGSSGQQTAVQPCRTPAATVLIPPEGCSCFTRAFPTTFCPSLKSLSAMCRSHKTRLKRRTKNAQRHRQLCHVLTHKHST